MGQTDVLECIPFAIPLVAVFLMQFEFLYFVFCIHGNIPLYVRFLPAYSLPSGIHSDDYMHFNMGVSWVVHGL